MSDRHQNDTPPPARLAAAAAAAAAVLVLAACGGDAPSAAAPGGSAPSASADADLAFPAPHAPADVAFARDMVVHHRGALEMAALASERAADPEVRLLAEEIAAAQEPEIEQMSDLLRSWGEAGPDEEAGHGRHGGAGGMAGMTDPEVDALRAARGAEFDRLFLEQMVAHHEDAIAMAQAEVRDGRSPAARDLATRIAADQAAEVAEMRAMLAAR